MVPEPQRKLLPMIQLSRAGQSRLVPFFWMLFPSNCWLYFWNESSSIAFVDSAIYGSQPLGWKPSGPLGFLHVYRSQARNLVFQRTRQGSPTPSSQSIMPRAHLCRTTHASKPVTLCHSLNFLVVPPHYCNTTTMLSEVIKELA